jgi:hypothetical protein
MDSEIKTYLKAEAIIAAAFNFFINGMVAALIHHKADTVATDALSVAIDLTITCLVMFIITELFCRASLKQTKSTGILDSGNKIQRLSVRLFRWPVLFGAALGFSMAIVLFALIAPVFALLGVQALPFGAYIALKTISCALLGGGVALICLYAGLHK